MRPILLSDTHDHVGFPINHDVDTHCPDEVFDYLCAMEREKKCVVIDTRYKVRCLHAAEIRLGAIMKHLRQVNDMNLVPVNSSYLEYLQREHEQLYGKAIPR